jgi:hypothetical protein
MGSRRISNVERMFQPIVAKGLSRLDSTSYPHVLVLAQVTCDFPPGSSLLEISELSLVMPARLFLFETEHSLRI